MKVPDLRLNLIMASLRSISMSRIGELAQTCGSALFALSKPLALEISIKLPGLDEDRFSEGSERHRQILIEHIKEYGLIDYGKSHRPPNFIAVSTDDDRSICIITIKNQGNVLGYIAALSEGETEYGLQLAELGWLCGTQLSLRVHSILSPASQLKPEIMGRQLLNALRTDGVSTLAVGMSSGENAWLSLVREGEIIRVREIDRLPQEQVNSINDGEIIGENTLKYLWSDSRVSIGVWVSAAAGYYLALGFKDRKSIAPGILSKAKDQIEARVNDDVAYLAKSFEKLKVNFKKLVKSERAAAVTETTVTINHEINNPLTAILGNTQLMLMSRDKLSPDIVTKLETIERSAIKIRETTTKLMSIIDPVTSPYASGLEMIDIEKSKKKKSSQ